MQEVEFQIPPSAELTLVDSTIESTCAAECLRIGVKGTLGSFTGCVHWHFGRLGERGTLEITSFPSGRRIWAQIQDGRLAAWIDPCLASVKDAVEEKLKQSTGSVAERDWLNLIELCS